MARIESSDTDVTASLPQSAFASSNPVDDYPTFFSQNTFAVAEASSGRYVAGAFSESEIFEGLKPFSDVYQPGGLFTPAQTRYYRPILVVKDDHLVPHLGSVGFGPTGFDVTDNQAVVLDYASATNLQTGYLEVVEVQSTTQFTTILRDIPAELKVGYQNLDQVIVVDEIDLSREPDGTQTGVATTFLNDKDDLGSSGSRTGLTIDVTLGGFNALTPGRITNIAINSAGSGNVSGDLHSATLAQGGVIKFRFVNTSAKYTGFTAMLPIVINTATAHGLKVGDVFTCEHDNAAATLFGNAALTLEYGSVQFVDDDTFYFFFNGLVRSDFTNLSLAQGASTYALMKRTGATPPASSDLINPTSMALSTSANTVVQILNPTFKAVKLTCSSAWSIKQKGASAFTSVAANEVFILRYSGDSNAGFFAKADSGTPTLNWSYFVG